MRARAYTHTHTHTACSPCTKLSLFPSLSLSLSFSSFLSHAHRVLALHNEAPVPLPACRALLCPLRDLLAAHRAGPAFDACPFSAVCADDSDAAAAAAAAAPER